jgi:hypothetical protein
MFAYFVPIASVSSQTITFEQPAIGGTPSDNAELVNAYSLTDGGNVRFFFDVDGNNSFEEDVDFFGKFENIGGSDPGSGFLNFALNKDDTAADGYENQLGNWFLRQPTPFGTGSAMYPLIAKYNTPQTITALSGEIWDIDGGTDQPNSTERWKVEAINASGAVLETRISPTGVDNNGHYDGKPWVFSMTNLQAGVDAIRITFIGTKTSGLGLAFNNFSPTFSAFTPSGDFNLDGMIDSQDLAQWKDAIGPSSEADGDGDGDSDGSDFLIWQRDFGGPIDLQATSMNTVPESSTYVMAGMLLCFIGSYGRRLSNQG